MNDFKSIDNYSFRELYGSFCIINDKNRANIIAAMIESSKNPNFKVKPNFFDNDEFYESPINKKHPSNGFLAYCFVDHIKGLHFLYITNVLIDNGEITFYKRDNFNDVFTNKKRKDFKIKIIDDVEEYSDYVENFIEKNSSLELNKIRENIRLDELRNNHNPDDILVCFSKDGFENENLWVRFEKMENLLLFKGNLLDEPTQDFGIKKGDEVQVVVVIDEQDNTIAFALID